MKRRALLLLTALQRKLVNARRSYRAVSLGSLYFWQRQRQVNFTTFTNLEASHCPPSGSRCHNCEAKCSPKEVASS